MIQAFHASIARCRAEVVTRLRIRFGQEIVSRADIRVGFHRHTPIVIALVPCSLSEVIVRIEQNGELPSVSCFAVDIEQRVRI